MQPQRKNESRPRRSRVLMFGLVALAMTALAPLAAADTASDIANQTALIQATATIFPALANSFGPAALTFAVWAVVIAAVLSPAALGYVVYSKWKKKHG